MIQSREVTFPPFFAKSRQQNTSYHCYIITMPQHLTTLQIIPDPNKGMTMRKVEISISFQDFLHYNKEIKTHTKVLMESTQVGTLHFPRLRSHRHTVFNILSCIADCYQKINVVIPTRVKIFRFCSYKAKFKPYIFNCNFYRVGNLTIRLLYEIDNKFRIFYRYLTKLNILTVPKKVYLAVPWPGLPIFET